MRVQINGKPEELNEGLSVAALLQKMNLNPEALAVEVNLEIISKAERSQCRLKEGDVIEIVKMVGGGNA